MSGMEGLGVNPEVAEGLVRYLEIRREQRAEQTRQQFEALTDREQALVREAAVLAFVHGVQHGRTHRTSDVRIPTDATIVDRVLSAADHFAPDLYPTLAGLGK